MNQRYGYYRLCHRYCITRNELLAFVSLTMITEKSWPTKILVSKQWKEVGGGDSFWNNGTSECRGVAILSKRNLNNKVKLIHKNNDGRVSNVEIEMEGETYGVINIYTPNAAKDKVAFLTWLKNYINKKNEQNLIVLGDFNCTLDKSVDRYPINQNEDIGNIQLKLCIDNNDLEDIWRIRYPTKKISTFARGNAKSRIDYIFTSSRINFRIEKCNIINCIYSDHDAIGLTIKTNEIERGPGYWKLSSKIVESVEFKNTIESFWKYWKTKIPNYTNITK